MHDRHYANAPKNGIPAGGGDWMDCFFRMETIRGFMNGLRAGKTTKESFEDGVAVGEIAVELWNKKREWQVHRWKGFPRSYLTDVWRKAKRELQRQRSV